MEKTNLTPSAILTVVLVLRLKPQGEGVMQILFPKLKLGANYFFFCVFCGYMFSHLVCKLFFLCLLWLYVFSLGVKTISFVFFVAIFFIQARWSVVTVRAFRLLLSCVVTSDDLFFYLYTFSLFLRQCARNNRYSFWDFFVIKFY